MIEPENTEFRTTTPDKWAEGSCDEKPSEDDVKDYLLKEGYLSMNIDVWFDNMMQCWQWYADICPLNEL